jgi:hypothetical protein
MSLCRLNQDGAMLVHRPMPAGPDPFLTAIAPSREDLVVCVACLFTWDWLADLCARAAMPFVLGHALSLQAIHGGQAQNETIDAQKIAVLFRGGLLPQAYVSPAELRATRDLLRRRLPLMRHRAARLAHIPKTPSQDTRPEMGKKSASKANRAGVAERFPKPAVPKRVAVDRALMDHDDRRRRDVELSILPTAQPHNATTLSLRRTVPGIGAILRVVLRSDLHDLPRFPRVQACVADGRRVTCATASAGKRSGTSGAKSGHASLTWAFAEAAVVCLRTHPAGQTSLARLEKQPGKGKALTGRAPQLARAVSQRCKRETACDRPRLLQRAAGAERVSLTPHWTSTGCA